MTDLYRGAGVYTCIHLSGESMIKYLSLVVTIHSVLDSSSYVDVRRFCACGYIAWPLRIYKGSQAFTFVIISFPVVKN